MKKNVCGLDRLVRLVLGTALLLVGLRSVNRSETNVTLRQVIVLYAAADLLVTGLARWCPMNALLGIDTCGGTTGDRIRRIPYRA